MLSRSVTLKRCIGMVLAFVLIAGCAVMVPQTAEAAGQWVCAKKLKADLDRNGRKENIQLQIHRNKEEYGSYWDRARIVINGRTAWQFKEWEPYGLDSTTIIFRMIKLKNGKRFLDAHFTFVGDGECWEYLFRYRNGKLKMVLDAQDDAVGWLFDYTNHSYIKVKGNTVWVSGHELYTGISKKGSSVFWLRVPYVFKNGRFVKKSKTCPTSKRDNPSLTARKKIRLYRSPGGKQAGMLKKGTRIKVRRIRFGSGQKGVIAYQIKSKDRKINNKWFKDKGNQYAFK